MQSVFPIGVLVSTAGWAVLLAACAPVAETPTPPKPVYIAVAPDGTVTVDGEAAPEGEDPMDYVRRRLRVPPDDGRD